MKFLLLIVTILAVARAEEEFFRNAEEVCVGMSQACINNLLNSLLGDTSEAEVCGELKHAIDCLEEAVDECPSDEDKEEVADGLRELEGLMRETCERVPGHQKPVVAQRNEQQELDEVSACLVENEDYINMCIFHGAEYAMSILSADATEDLIKCAMFGMMASCHVQRVGEKCGDKAAKMADEELATPPPEVQLFCRDAGADPYSFQFQEPQDEERE